MYHCTTVPLCHCTTVCAWAAVERMCREQVPRAGPHCTTASLRRCLPLSASVGASAGGGADDGDSVSVCALAPTAPPLCCGLWNIG
eukprot:1764127-Pyramimonas_sp.AAC.1